MKTTALSFIIIIATPLLAHADVVHLKNGRTVEGQVLKQTRMGVHIAIPGGKLFLHHSQIKAIEDGDWAKDEYAKRHKKVDKTDPAALIKLATWAAANGLGKESQDLSAMARGMLLQKWVARAKKRNTAEAFVDTYHWARSAGVSHETQLWLIEQARKIENVAIVKQAMGLFRQDLARKKAKLTREAESRRRPKYIDPYAPKAAGVAGGTSFKTILSDPESRRKLARYRQAKERARRRALEKARKQRAERIHKKKTTRKKPTKRTRRKKTKRKPVYVDPGR